MKKNALKLMENHEYHDILCKCQFFAEDGNLTKHDTAVKV